MPLRKARQALATSKFWQFSASPRLPATMLAVDGSRKSRLTEVLTSRPTLSREMPASSRAFSPASVAASEARVSASHMRREWMPAMSPSTSVLIPRRSMVGLSWALISAELNACGASIWARPAMATCSNSMGLTWAETLPSYPFCAVWLKKMRSIGVENPHYVKVSGRSRTLVSAATARSVAERHGLGAVLRRACTAWAPAQR